MSILQPNVLPVGIDISRNIKRSLESTPVQVEMEMRSKKQTLTLIDDGSVDLVEGDIN